MRKSFLLASSAAVVIGTVPDDEYGQAFKDFETSFQRKYLSEQQRESRFEIFKGNYIYIAAENAKGINLYELGVNDFTDLSNKEFAETHFGYVKATQRYGGVKHLGTHEYNGEELPTSVDWRNQGAVTPVKNQASCGSCWAFSTTGSMEGAWKIASGNLVSLSEEQLVACSKQNHGCQGGSMELGFAYEEGTVVCTEQSYPYSSGGGSVGACQASSCTAGIPKGGVTGYKTVASGDKNALMSAVAQQPVSIAVEADKSVFQSYRSGVMTGSCGTNLDHGILAIGYGTTGGQDYWLVKNSWGSSWGISGYGMLERGKGGKGECGILSDDSYPVVKGSGPPSPPSPPSPPAPPTPPTPPSPPPPAPPGGYHYGHPPCRSDEKQLRGPFGDMCTSECSGPGSCPTDVTPGVTAAPKCDIIDDQGMSWCSLDCSDDSECDVKGGAQCMDLGPAGVCFYPATGERQIMNFTKKSHEIGHVETVV